MSDKIRTRKIKDVDDYGHVRIYIAPHKDVDLWGDDWQYSFEDREDPSGFGGPIRTDARPHRVLIAFRQKGEDPFTIVVEQSELVAALREVGL